MSGIDAIEAAYASATGKWTGLDWDSSSLDHAADQIEAGKRVDLDDLTLLGPSDGSYAAAGVRSALRAIKTRIEDMIDDDTDAETRAEVIAECRELAEQERAYVEERAEAAETAAAEAIDYARTGDLRQALKHASKAANIEAEFGDWPTWGRLRKAVETACFESEE